LRRLFTIREFEVADEATAARIVELQHAAYAVEAGLIGFVGIPPLHDKVEDIMDLEISWVGAFEGDRLVGGIAYVDNSDGRDIDRLFVDPAKARRGIGKALVGFALGAAKVTVSTGTKNAPAIALYSALGFRPAGHKVIAPGVTITSLVYTAEQPP